MLQHGGAWFEPRVPGFVHVLRQDIVLGEWEWFMYHDIVGTMVEAVMHDFM